jgi:Leucine-rich repeat (LRR) protein
MLAKNLKQALENPTVVTGLILKLGGAKEIPWEVFTLPNLAQLEIFGEKIKEIPAGFGNLSRLHTFFMTSPALERIAPELFALPFLETLKIKHGNLGTLPEVHPRCLNLKILHFSHTHLEMAPEWLSLFHRLEVLNLSNNRLKTLPDSYRNLKTLKWVDLDGNLMERLPDCLFSLPKVHHLSIDQNPFPPEEKLRISQLFSIWFS